MLQMFQYLVSHSYTCQFAEDHFLILTFRASFNVEIGRQHTATEIDLTFNMAVGARHAPRNWCKC